MHRFQTGDSSIPETRELSEKKETGDKQCTEDSRHSQTIHPYVANTEQWTDDL